LIRNALTAQNDQSAAVILAGGPGNLVGLLALPDGKRWAEKKARVLLIAAGRFDTQQPDPVLKSHVAAFRKLLAEWPGAIVLAGAELGEALPFPVASIESDFAWAPNHPVVDAYRAYHPMPYDATTQAMAAALYAAQPGEGYFRVSDPGTVNVLDDGRVQFTPSANGRHRYLISDPAQGTIQAYTHWRAPSHLLPPRRGGRRSQKPDHRSPGPLAAIPFKVAGRISRVSTNRFVHC
jgi:hypothetical protein